MLDELQRRNGDRLTVVHTLTSSQPPGWAGYARRVDDTVAIHPTSAEEFVTMR